MYAHVLNIGERGCGGSGDWHELRALLRAMSGGRHRHRHHGRGSGHGGLGGLGLSGFGGPGGGHWRGRKARRGDIRSAALLLLAEEPRNGYQIMQEVGERSGGVWSPSPGSVYPALQQLEDEGLIRAEEIEGRKLYAITDAGREQVQARDAALPAPWEAIGGDAGTQLQELAHTLRATAMAAAQVLRTGNEAQVAEAQRVMAAARRDLYRVLAEDDIGAEGSAEG